VRRQLLPLPAEAFFGRSNGNSTVASAAAANVAFDLRMYVMVWHRVSGAGAGAGGGGGHGHGMRARTLVLTAGDIILATEAVARFHETFGGGEGGRAWHVLPATLSCAFRMLSN